MTKRTRSTLPSAPWTAGDQRGLQPPALGTRTRGCGPGHGRVAAGAEWKHAPFQPTPPPWLCQNRHGQGPAAWHRKGKRCRRTAAPGGLERARSGFARQESAPDGEWMVRSMTASRAERPTSALAAPPPCCRGSPAWWSGPRIISLVPPRASPSGATGTHQLLDVADLSVSLTGFAKLDSMTLIRRRTSSPSRPRPPPSALPPSSRPAAGTSSSAPLTDTGWWVNSRSRNPGRSRRPSSPCTPCRRMAASWIHTSTARPPTGCRPRRDRRSALQHPGNVLAAGDQRGSLRGRHRRASRRRGRSAVRGGPRPAEPLACGLVLRHRACPHVRRH